MRHTRQLLVLAFLLGSVGCVSDNYRSPRARDDEQQPAVSNGATSRNGDASVASATDDTVRQTLAIPTGDRASSTLLVERLAPREARLNRAYDYRIRVTNLTQTPLTGVVVREKLPENFTISKSEPTGKDENGWQTYTIGDMPALAARTIDVSGVPKAEGKMNTSIAVDYKPTLSAVVEVVNPILKLAKDGPSEVDICEGIRYRYVVSNVGTGTEKDVTIEDVLPEGVTTDDGKKTVVLRIGDVPQSASKEVTVRVKPAKTGQYASAAVAKAPGSQEVRSQEVSTLVRQPKLDVAVAGPATEYLNKTATYTVTVKNVGDAPARRTVLGIDAGTYGEVATVMIGGGPKGEPQTAAYHKEGADLETLAPGESRTVTVSVRTLREGRLPLTAAAVANCVGTTTAKTVTQILTLPALRLEVVDLDDPIRVGDQVVYRISVKNQGTGADKNVTVTATLPAEMQFEKSEGPTDAKADGRVLHFAPVETLGAGKEVIWRVAARATHPGDVRMQVQLKSDSLSTPATESEPTKLY